MTGFLSQFALVVVSLSIGCADGGVHSVAVLGTFWFTRPAVNHAHVFFGFARRHIHHALAAVGYSVGAKTRAAILPHITPQLFFTTAPCTAKVKSIVFIMLFMFDL